MLIKTLAVTILLSTAALANAQILGGGTNFSNAVLFNQSWIAGCPSGTSLSNQLAFDPNAAIDPCAPAPTCTTGLVLSDVWFYFFAEATTATIVINPSPSFNVALQAFSGNTCPGLTEIGCIDAGENGATETLKLTGLIPHQLYYFRIFGSAPVVTSKTTSGTYDFCGSTQLNGGAVLAVEISNFSASRKNNIVELNWSAIATTFGGHFEIERSSNGITFQSIGKVTGNGIIAQSAHYNFDDTNPFTTGVNYYRLKEISANGSYKYSAVVSVKMEGKLQRSVTVLSNPVKDKLQVRISSDAATATELKIINDLGQVIWQQKGTVVKGDNYITVTGTQLHDLPQGMYTLQVRMSNETINTKFISTK